MFKSFILFILMSIFCTNIMYSDEMKDKYVQLLKNQKYEELFQHLKIWEKKSPNDPEMFIAYFNYYYSKGKQNVIRIDKKQRSNPTIKLTDPKTGEVVGYFNDGIYFNDDDVSNAITYIDKGICLYPDRLDMHLGKIHLLGEMEDYNNMTLQLIKVMDLSKSNKNKWLWSDGKARENAKDFVIESIQGRTDQIFNLAKEEYDNLLFQLASKMIECYPDILYGYSDLGSYYMLKNNYKEGLNLYKKAELINPNDVIVLLNIGNAYKKLNDTNNAIKYYKKVISIGDSDNKEYAKKQIENLKH